MKRQHGVALITVLLVVAFKRYYATHSGRRIVDGVMYALGEVFERGRKARLGESVAQIGADCRTFGNDAAAVRTE